MLFTRIPYSLSYSRPFLSSTCLECFCKSEAKCQVFTTKTRFHSYANDTNFHTKSFALSLNFIMRFIATRKWHNGQKAELACVSDRMFVQNNVRPFTMQFRLFCIPPVYPCSHLNIHFAPKMASYLICCKCTSQ